MKRNKFSALRAVASICGMTIIAYGYSKASHTYKMVKGYSEQLMNPSTSNDAYLEAMASLPSSIDIYLFMVLFGTSILILSALPMRLLMRQWTRSDH